MYLPCAGYFEGVTDREYFRVLIPRIIYDIIAKEGTRTVIIPDDLIYLGLLNRSVEAVAEEACAWREAFHIWFVHADTGGRALATRIDERSLSYIREAHAGCGLLIERSVVLAPKKEMESWVLADREAVLSAFGLPANFADDNLPARPALCENLDDPKATIDEFAKSLNRKRYRGGAAFLFPSIAMAQSLEKLRQLPSFQSFETDLKVALRSLGCIAVRR